MIELIIEFSSVKLLWDDWNYVNLFSDKKNRVIWKFVIEFKLEWFELN